MGNNVIWIGFFSLEINLSITESMDINQTKYIEPYGQYIIHTHTHTSHWSTIGDNANIEKYVNRMRSNVCVWECKQKQNSEWHMHTHTNDYHRNYSQFFWISKFQMKFFINEIEAKKCHYEAIIMNDESFFSVKKN